MKKRWKGQTAFSIVWQQPIPEAAAARVAPPAPLLGTTLSISAPSPGALDGIHECLCFISVDFVHPLTRCDLRELKRILRWVWNCTKLDIFILVNEIKTCMHWIWGLGMLKSFFIWTHGGCFFSLLNFGLWTGSWGGVGPIGSNGRVEREFVQGRCFLWIGHTLRVVFSVQVLYLLLD